MISRRLASSFAGSCFIVAVMGCNALVGNEDVDYTDTTTKKSTPDAGDAGKGPIVGPNSPDKDASASSDASFGDDASTITDASADD